MGLRPETRARQVWKVVATIAGLLLTMEVLGGSATCIVTNCNDDDDDHCDHDHDHSSSSSALNAQVKPAIDWTLREYQVLPAGEPGAHPVRGVIDIRGFSLRSKLGPGVWGDPEIEQFTSQILRANAALIGLPEGPGRLRFDSIDHQPACIRATYVQELVDERDVATRVPGAALTFVLDRQGRLLEIDGSLRLDGVPVVSRKPEVAR